MVNKGAKDINVQITIFHFMNNEANETNEIQHTVLKSQFGESDIAVFKSNILSSMLKMSFVLRNKLLEKMHNAVQCAKQI